VTATLLKCMKLYFSVTQMSFFSQGWFTIAFHGPVCWLNA